MEKTKLIVKKRDLEGTSNTRRLRRTGALPGVIYGGDKDASSISLDAHIFEQMLHHSASESVIIEIDLEGEGDVSALIKDIQRHPVTHDAVHVDLLRIVAGHAIHVTIPLEFVGEAAGVNAGGILDQVMHEIAVEVLPRNLVDSFEVNVSELEIGESIHVSDLKLGANFNLLVDETAIVASVAAPRVEAEVEEAAAAEPEVINEKKAEDAE